MTDNEIIKALECCVKTEFISDCAKCEMLAFDCKDTLIEYALDLINRQKDEIERLRNSTKDIFMKATTHMNDIWDKIKSEAMKEFAERLKEKLQWDVEFDNKLVFESDIDNLVKEMTEV